MSETKDNHYVPRLYLRNFTDDPLAKNGKFDLLNLSSEEHIGIVPHATQMKERYFYEKGSEIEAKLGEEFEGKHATLIKDILEKKLPPPSSSLLEVALLMHFRTRAQRDENLALRKHIIDRHMGYLVSSFKSHLRKKLWIFAKLIDDKMIGTMVKQGAYGQYLKKTDSSAKQIKNFEKINSEMTGLNCVILDNKNAAGLISSDRPVLLVNPFLQRKQVNFGKDGMYQMGILLLLPISPEKLLVCYDPNIYENPQITCANALSESDVEKLNRLQVQCAVGAIYSRVLPQNIKSLVTEVMSQKKQPQIITVDLPGGYELTYKESNLPNYSFNFLKEKSEAESIKLKLPYSRPTDSIYTHDEIQLKKKV
jgi:hypothetical protein